MEYIHCINFNNLDLSKLISLLSSAKYNKNYESNNLILNTNLDELLSNLNNNIHLKNNKENFIT
jgi:hypothetical protein